MMPAELFQAPGDIALARNRMEASRLLRSDRIRSDPDAIDRVLFLQFQLNQHEVRLLSANSRPGRPLRARTAFHLSDLAPGIVIHALDAQGEIVWQEAIRDPSVLRCCYEHAAGGGLLTGEDVVLDSVHFSIRVPDIPEIISVVLYRNPGNRGSSGPVVSPENSMGRFTVRP
jgi:hypothetical protein